MSWVWIWLNSFVEPQHDSKVRKMGWLSFRIGSGWSSSSGGPWPWSDQSFGGALERFLRDLRNFSRESEDKRTVGWEGLNLTPIWNLAGGRMQL